MVLHEVGEAVRRLRRAWRLSLIATATLGLAIGACGAAFSLLDSIVLEKLRVTQPDRLVSVAPMRGEAVLGIPAPALADFGDRQDVFDQFCGFSRGTLAVEIKGQVSRRPHEGLTGRCFQIAGAKPLLGRLLDDSSAPILSRSEAVVVLSHQFWTTALDSDPQVVGTTLSVQATPVMIIGVASPEFHGFNRDQPPDLFVPLGLTPQLLGFTGVRALFAIGLLRDGVSLTQARSRLMATVWPDWTKTYTSTSVVAPPVLRIESLARGFSDLRRRYAPALLALIGLSGTLLLLACINVGGLVLARTIASFEEFAILLALGANRGRIGFRVCAEGALIGLASAVWSLGIAWAISGGVARTLWTSVLPMRISVTPDSLTVALVLITGIASGIAVSAPSLLVVLLKTPNVSMSSARTVIAAQPNSRRVLVAIQVAVSFALVFCSGLFLETLGRLKRIDPGYEKSGLYFSRLEPIPGVARLPDPGLYLQALLQTVSTSPRVSNVALSSAFPTTEIFHLTALTPVAAAEEVGAQQVGVAIDRISPGFFASTGIALRGRDFTWNDTAQQPAVAIINATLASRLFPSIEPIGRQVRMISRKQDVTVIGVARDASPGDARISELPYVYRPLTQEPQAAESPVLLIRAKSMDRIADDARVAVASVGRHQLNSFSSVDDQFDRFFATERVLAGLSAVFTGVGLALGLVGLYALMSYSVIRRTSEIGLRLALGATRSQIVVSILSEGLTILAAGVGVGIPVALGIAQLVRPFLHRTSPFDPLVGATAVALLMIVGISACIGPAARASRTQSAVALRCN